MYDGGAHLAVRATVPPSRYPPGGRPSAGPPLLAGRAPARTGPWLGAGCQARPRAKPGGLDAAGGVEAGCLRSRAAGQPAPPAGIRAGRLHPRQRRGRARGHRPGPPRTRPCRPSPPAGPGRPPALAPPRSSTAGPFLFPRVPGPAAPGSGLPPPAGRGPDLTGGRSGASVVADPRTGRPRERQPLPAGPRHPGRSDPGTPDDPLLTIEEVTAELRVSRAAFYRWRRQGAGPAAVRLPGGGVRVRRSALTRVAAPAGSRHARRTGARSRWTVTTSGSGTPRRSPTTPAAARYRVRWAVDGQEHCKSFKARPLADGFLDGLKDAARDRRPFNPRTGLPGRRGHRGGDGHLVRACPQLRRGQVARAWPRSPAGRSPRPWSP